MGSEGIDDDLLVLELELLVALFFFCVSDGGGEDDEVEPRSRG